VKNGLAIRTTLTEMTNTHRGEERRSSLSRKLRPVIDQELIELRMLYSTIAQAEKQKLPPKSLKAVETTCEILTKKIRRQGMPAYRLKEIIEQALS